MTGRLGLCCPPQAQSDGPPRASTDLAGQSAAGHLLAGCAGHRRSSAHSGLKLSSPARGWLGPRTIRITAIGENRSHNTVSAVSRVRDHGPQVGISSRRDRPVRSATKTAAPIWPEGARSGRSQSQPPTMLTVLTYVGRQHLSDKMN